MTPKTAEAFAPPCPDRASQKERLPSFRWLEPAPRDVEPFSVLTRIQRLVAEMGAAMLWIRHYDTSFQPSQGEKGALPWRG
jgi:hypothetical protein